MKHIPMYLVGIFLRNSFLSICLNKSISHLLLSKSEVRQYRGGHGYPHPYPHKPVPMSTGTSFTRARAEVVGSDTFLSSHQSRRRVR